MSNPPAIVVTFNPPPEFLVNLEALLDQLDEVLVIDNGSGGEMRDLLKRELMYRGAALTVIFNEVNLGVAAAINQGFRWAIEKGYDSVLVFDQDSRPAPGMVAELLHVYNSHPVRDKVAIVAPQIEDWVTGERISHLRERGVFSLERVPCRDSVIEDVMLVITSGSLNNLRAFGEVGVFRDEFFVDYVDTEYCLRLRHYGYRIVVACNAVLQHRLGEQQRKRIGSLSMRPTFHSPLRWYYINRNRVVMYGLYALRFPSWAFHDFMTGNYAFLKMILFEDHKIKKILALLLGITDGMLHRMGPISPSRKRLISEER